MKRFVIGAMLLLVACVSCGGSGGGADAAFCGHLEELRDTVDREISGSQVSGSTFSTFKDQFESDSTAFDADGNAEMSGVADDLARVSGQYASSLDNDGFGLIPVRMNMEDTLDEVPNGFC